MREGEAEGWDCRGFAQTGVHGISAFGPVQASLSCCWIPAQAALHCRGQGMAGASLNCLLQWCWHMRTQVVMKVLKMMLRVLHTKVLVLSRPNREEGGMQAQRASTATDGGAPPAVLSL